MTFPFGEPITITNRTLTGQDGDNNAIYTDGPTATVSGAFAPAIGFESNQGEDQVSTQPHAYVPDGTAVDSLSMLTIRGLDYEVDGTPNVWVSPFTGWRPGIDVPLKRVTG